jgi:uncharacterized protein involved in response to NO
MKRIVLFAQGLRPFFLLAGLDAVFNIGVWLAAYLRPELWPATLLPGPFWHGHEMIFGFTAAAVGGFLLTAVPGWTGRASYAGIPLMGLSALWLLGRVAMFPLAHVPAVAAAVIDLAFFPALALTLAPPLIRARKINNLPFLVLLTALFVADLLFHLDSLGALENGMQIGLGLAADIIIILIVVIGGRIIPAFTRAGMMRRGKILDIAAYPWLERLAIASAVAVLIGDLVAAQSAANGAVAFLAAVLQAARLIQWKGWRAWREPLIWVLHLGYGWLVVGLALKGAWLLLEAPVAAKWLHAFTVGCFATMILAVMTRASLGHTGRALQAPRSMTVSYLLVTLAAVVRVFGPAIAENYDAVIAVSGTLWLAAFALFTIVYAPILTMPRADGRPG